MHLRMLPDHPKHGLQKDIFNVWSGLKRVLRRMLPDHQKKNNFLRLEWLKLCFNAFSHAYRPPEKKNF